MPNFSIKYSYQDGEVICRKTAVVRASSVNAAKDKLVRFLTHCDSRVYSDFKFDKISISSYNLILV